MPSPSEKIAASLAGLTREHGAPNSFAAHEIAFHAGVSRLAVGQTLSRENRLVDEALAKRGLRLANYGKRDGYSYADIEEIE